MPLRSGATRVLLSRLLLPAFLDKMPAEARARELALETAAVASRRLPPAVVRNEGARSVTACRSGAAIADCPDLKYMSLDHLSPVNSSSSGWCA
eukprot:CAMPEP_0179469882 /NCGR_PEP_ID=MMETSP0799-20121207/50445_1 /TAXON_ID=46947 /ORGANISM="Geminigera cryophila, Strain CCMP2564" /LENGTH=93 /DNA_ID=CAMNT_0021276603 /DNA_START=843 /DNA_END=1124 /DNA_ORIENTATION=-